MAQIPPFNSRFLSQAPDTTGQLFPSPGEQELSSNPWIPTQRCHENLLKILYPFGIIYNL